MEKPDKEPIFHVNIDAEGQATFFSPSEVDMFTAPYIDNGLRETLLREDVRGVILDLGRTSFLDSTGVHTLIMFKENATALDKTYALQNLRGLPEKVLKITGVLAALNPEKPASS